MRYTSQTHTEAFSVLFSSWMLVRSLTKSTFPKDLSPFFMFLVLRNLHCDDLHSLTPPLVHAHIHKAPPPRISMLVWSNYLPITSLYKSRYDKCLYKHMNCCTDAPNNGLIVYHIINIKYPGEMALIPQTASIFTALVGRNSPSWWILRYLIYARTCQRY